MKQLVKIYEEILTEGKVENLIASQTWYHGSKNTNLTFNDPKSGKSRKTDMQLDFGTHFTSKEYAQFYAKDGGKVYFVKLSPKKTLDLTDSVVWADDPRFNDLLQLFNELKPAGWWKKQLLSYTDKNGNKQNTVQLVGVTSHLLNDITPNKVFNVLRSLNYDSILYEPYHPGLTTGGHVGGQFQDKSVIALTKSIIKVIGSE